MGKDSDAFYGRGWGRKEVEEAHERISQGTKFDRGKSPLSLIDRHAVEKIGEVLAFGRDKYGAHNWRKGFEYSRLLDASLRHLYAFADGVDLDDESQLSHIAHAACCLVFLLGLQASGKGVDDRHTALPEANE